MPASLKVDLSAEQRAELESARASHPKPYLRERASAILKVADGQSARQVAEHGLLKRHEPETVSQWVKTYLRAGLGGLKVKPGAGRKPSFFPPDRRRRRRRTD